ncbi:MAG TPA: amidohydrolase family protein [Caulobacteraceae bacterium]|nr:amidohydrolase family protein [Caulobacteraceae bacterium]
MDTRSKQLAASSRRSAIAGGLSLALAPALAAAQALEEIIDIHPHIISADVTRYPPHPFGGVPSDFAKQRPLPFEELVAQMNAAGVAKAAIVQVSTFYGVDDSYLADCVASDPHRFAGVCSIDTFAPDAVKTLAGWRKCGLAGLRIFTGGGTQPAMLADPRAFPVWEYVEQEGVPVCVDTHLSGLDNLAVLLRRYPKAVVVLDHAADPALDEGPPYRQAQALFDLAAYPNLNLKVTSRTILQSRAGKSTPEAFFSRLVAAYGARRMAFGSNIPATPGPLSAVVADARGALSFLSAADRALIFAGTAKRIYPALA